MFVSCGFVVWLWWIVRGEMFILLLIIVWWLFLIGQWLWCLLLSGNGFLKLMEFGYEMFCNWMYILLLLRLCLWLLFGSVLVFGLWLICWLQFVKGWVMCIWGFGMFVGVLMFRRLILLNMLVLKMCLVRVWVICVGWEKLYFLGG